MKISRTRAGRGFTLVEVVFTLVLLGILLIAIVPRLNSGRETSRDATAQSSLEAVMNAQAQILTAQGKVSDGGDEFALLKSYQPEVSYVRGSTASPDPETVSVHVVSSGSGPGPVTQTVTLAALGGQGSCFYLQQQFTGRVPGPAVHGIRDAGDPANCQGLLFQTGAGSGDSWSDPVEVP